MTVNPSIDPARLLEEQLAQASPDLLRELLTRFINTLMSAEADAVCGAAYGTSSPERTNRRNGYGPVISIPAPALCISQSPSCGSRPTSRVAVGASQARGAGADFGGGERYLLGVSTQTNGQEVAR